MSENIGGYLPHQERVIAEKAALDESLQKLAAFMAGEVFDAMPEEDRYLMQLQSSVMLSYSMLLGKRIERFTPAKLPKRISNLGGYAAMDCACGAVPVLSSTDHDQVLEVGCVCGSLATGNTPFMAVKAWNKLQQEQGG